MVVKREKKVKKYRGSVTHGGGHRKKRRGSGSRGGRGNAGTGKRAGQKKAGMKERRLGRHGFTSLYAAVKRYSGKHVMNVGQVQESLQKWLAEGSGSVRKEGQAYKVNLAAIGCTKLLGAGVAKDPIDIIVNSWSAPAEQKVTAAGGSIVRETGGSIVKEK